jgi:hypothetical protein
MKPFVSFRPIAVGLLFISLASTPAPAVIGGGGPLRKSEPAELAIPFYKDGQPVFKVGKTGNAKFQLNPASVQGVPVSEGLSVRIEPSHARGAHSVELTWEFEAGQMDWSKGAGLEVWFRPLTSAAGAYDFVDDIGVVGTRFLLHVADGQKRTTRTACYISPQNWGKWQRLRLGLRFGDRWDAGIDKRDIRRVTLSIPALKEKGFGFELAGFGVYQNEEHTGPSLSIQVRPAHLVIAPNEAFSFAIGISKLPFGEKAEVVVRATDVFGKTEERTYPVISKGSVNLMARAFPNRGQGWLRFSATLRYQDRDVYQWQWMMGSLPAWSAQMARPGPAMPWGFWPGAGPDAELLGASWTRLRITQSYLTDPEFKGVLPVDNGEWRMVQGEPRNLRSIAFFGHDRPWKDPARPNWGGGVDWEKYRAVLNEAVKQCHASGIRFYEVINEPNTAHGPSIDQLVELHRVVYETVKTVDPAARVLGPSPYNLDVSYIEKFFAAGGANYIDDLSMHAYNSNDEIANAFPRLRQTLDANGKMASGIYITETGVNVPPYPLEQQAALAVQRNVLLFALGAKTISWHALSEWGWNDKAGADRADGMELGFCMSTFEGEPTPAFIAFGVMTRLLGEVTPAGSVPDLPQGARGFRFASKDKTVEVLWYEKSGSISVNVPVTTDTKLFDIMGCPQDRPAGDGSAPLVLTQTPVYLITSKPRP